MSEEENLNLLLEIKRNLEFKSEKKNRIKEKHLDWGLK